MAPMMRRAPHVYAIGFERTSGPYVLARALWPATSPNLKNLQQSDGWFVTRVVRDASLDREMIEIDNKVGI